MLICRIPHVPINQAMQWRWTTIMLTFLPTLASLTIAIVVDVPTIPVIPVLGNAIKLECSNLDFLQKECIITSDNIVMCYHVTNLIYVVAVFIWLMKVTNHSSVYILATGYTCSKCSISLRTMKCKNCQLMNFIHWSTNLLQLQCTVYGVGIIYPSQKK